MSIHSVLPGSLTRSDGLDRWVFEAMHISDLPTLLEALPSSTDGGGKSRKSEFSDQDENPAKKRAYSFSADLPTAAVAVSSVSLRSCMKDSLRTKSVGSLRWKPKDALEVEFPANLLDEVLVGSRPDCFDVLPSESYYWSSLGKTRDFFAKIRVGSIPEDVFPLDWLSLGDTMKRFGSTSLKKPSWSTWEKGEFLGRGTFGTVYEGVSSDGMFFAVKEVSLSDQGKTGKQAIRQLEQEIALLSEIEHPNIVQYLGTERDDEKLCIFLELVSKGSLAHVYEKYIVRYDQVRAYTKQILSGLKYLHDRKIIHRDIKCANILVDTSGVVKLADFGMAKQVDNLGRLKSFLGSAHWMAPEVINPKRSYNLMADIWSLGCTVLEMAIGKPPFGELEAHGVLWKVGHGEGPPIPDDLEEDLKSFINNCLVVNAAERPTCDLLMTHPFITGAPMNGPVKLVSLSLGTPSVDQAARRLREPAGPSSLALHVAHQAWRSRGVGPVGFRPWRSRGVGPVGFRPWRSIGPVRFRPWCRGGRISFLAQQMRQGVGSDGFRPWRSRGVGPVGFRPWRSIGPVGFRPWCRGGRISSLAQQMRQGVGPDGFRPWRSRGVGPVGFRLLRSKGVGPVGFCNRQLATLLRPRPRLSQKDVRIIRVPGKGKKMPGLGV